MSTLDLRSEIEKARKRLRLSKTEYARRVGVTVVAIRKIYAGGGVAGSTLALLQEHGDLRITKKLIASLERDPATDTAA